MVIFQIDYEEQEDVRWFHWSEVASMLAFEHRDGLWVPPRQALAHQLLKHWIRTLQSNL